MNKEFNKIPKGSRIKIYRKNSFGGPDKSVAAIHCIFERYYSEALYFIDLDSPEGRTFSLSKDMLYSGDYLWENTTIQNIIDFLKAHPEAEMLDGAHLNENERYDVLEYSPVFGVFGHSDCSIKPIEGGSYRASSFALYETPLKGGLTLISPVGKREDPSKNSEQPIKANLYLKAFKKFIEDNKFIG